MYELINKHCRDVLKQAEELDIPGYLKLRIRLANDGPQACSDLTFRLNYRKYWRMNAARLSDAFYTRYFDLLASSRLTGSANVESVVETLARVDGGEQETLHFSFATKLVHMVDPRHPIYDSFVAAFYFFQPAQGKPFADKLRRLMTFERFLRAEYDRVINGGLLRPSFDALREHFSIRDDVCDERLVDWLIWGWVSLLRKQDGRAYYA